MLVEEPLSLLSVELQSGALTKVSKVRTVQRTEDRRTSLRSF